MGRDMFRRYLRYFLERDRLHVFTFLAHKLTHICDDAELNKCGIGHNSAYPFENDMAILPRVRISNVSCVQTYLDFSRQFLYLYVYFIY